MDHFIPNIDHFKDKNTNSVNQEKLENLHINGFIFISPC